jgi:hypothetical protein
MSPRTGNASCLFTRWLLPATTLLAFGCAGGSNPVAVKLPRTMENLRAVNHSYHQAVSELRRPPTGKEEIAPYLKKWGDPNELLRSDNAGEPFEIAWGFDPTDGKAVHVVWAYEKSAKDGKRWVLRYRFVQEMDEEAFKKATFPPNHKPSF